MITKTVYSLIYPETETLLLKLWEKKPLDLYRRAYEGHQDRVHRTFFESYKNWIKGSVTLPSNFKEYPTAGSSEAIRESLADFASKCPRGRIHVFNGDYEGYEALARGYNLEVVKHDREDFSSLKDIKDHEPFYISQPSSINGCYWDKFPDFITYLETNSIKVKVRADLCYVGACTVEKPVDLSSDLVDMVFFSLSKTFGVYYHRIGGVFSKEEIPGLNGNVWFKNLFSLEFGSALLQIYPIGYLPRKYKHLQDKAQAKLLSEGIQTSPSDVLFLLHSSAESNPEYSRNSLWSRLCISPLLDKEFRP